MPIMIKICCLTLEKCADGQHTEHHFWDSLMNLARILRLPENFLCIAMAVGRVTLSAELVFRIQVEPCKRDTEISE